MPHWMFKTEHQNGKESWFTAIFALRFLMLNSDLLTISIFFQATSLYLLLNGSHIRYLHLHLAKQPRVNVLTGCRVCETKLAQLTLCREFDWQAIWPIITPFLSDKQPRQESRLTSGLELENGCIDIFPWLKQDTIWCSFMFISCYN